jgi:hypothetical protein
MSKTASLKAPHREPTSDWIRVEDRLPEEGEPVLVSSRYWCANPFVARLHSGEWEGEARPEKI